MEEARQWFTLALASTGVAYSVWRVSGLGSLALLEAWSGHTEQAETLADEALAIAQSVGMLAHPSTGDAFLAMTLTALDKGEPRRAAISLHQGSLRAEANQRTQLAWIAHLELALLRAAEGQLSQSAALLASQDLPAGPPPPIVDERLRALEVRLLRLQGYEDEAARISARAYRASEILEFERIAVALSTGQRDRARKLMDNIPGDTNGKNPGADLRTALELAWASSVDGPIDDAQMHLRRALELGARHSLREAFVQAGPVIVQLVRNLPGSRTTFQESILRRSREANAPSPEHVLLDPLTDRELEILSYLPSRFTNLEMAQRCYVSVNTIKTHMTHIYRKLDVVNRSGAIRRAQEIGLL
jgi:LuxR family maltose regulon positive regulatory protein